LPFTEVVSISTTTPPGAVSVKLRVPVGKYPADNVALSVTVEPTPPPDEAVVSRPGEKRR
jgi:hypothetical protein